MNQLKRKVKILCTLGPSSQSPEIIGKLIEAGMDVARLNFSHGDHAFHQRLIHSIRLASKKAQKPVAILQDLQGPKLRLGKLEGLVLLNRGDEVVLTSSSKIVAGKTRCLPVSADVFSGMLNDVRPGARILFDDGKVSSRVTKVGYSSIFIKIEVAGTLSSYKGLNLPDTPLSLSCLTQKDIRDLKFGLSQGVDAIALSFVRCPQDMMDLRATILKIKVKNQKMPLLISKIERPEAVVSIEMIDSILRVSDGVLIARGDMGVEIGVHRVPMLQKQLIARCNKMAISVITATQMLESMILSPVPTRAEASDVANAVLDGTDAVMLSAETASGQFPVQAVKMMEAIILDAQKAFEPLGLKTIGNQTLLANKQLDVLEDQSLFFGTQALLADALGLGFILCPAKDINSIRKLSQFRPKAMIVIATDSDSIERACCFLAGVYVVRVKASHYAVLRKSLTKLPWFKALKKQGFAFISEAKALDDFDCHVYRQKKDTVVVTI